MLILAHHNNNYPSHAISTFLPQTCEDIYFEASQRINHHSLKTSFIKKCPNAFRENRRRQRRHHFRPLLIGFHFYEFFMPGSGGGSVAPENQSRDVPAWNARERDGLSYNFGTSRTTGKPNYALHEVSSKSPTARQCGGAVKERQSGMR